VEVKILLFDDSKGQGAAEYLLLFGAIIIVAVAGLFIYYNYFNVQSNKTVDVKMDITSINTPYALKAVYEVDKNTNGVNKVISGGSTSFFYLNPGGTKTVNLGKFSSGESFTVMVGVGNPDVEHQDLPGSDWTGKNRWVQVKLTIGNDTTSWIVAGPYNWHINPSGGVSKSFTISGGKGVGLSGSKDVSTVRNTMA
jgi:hypothetical protein